MSDGRDLELASQALVGWAKPSEPMYDDAWNAGLTETLVRVADVAGPGYHSHGPWATDPLHLLRLGMCNLACDWCEVPNTVAILGADLDTTAPYIGMRQLLARLDDVLDTAPETPLLVSGGEPLLQDHALIELADHLSDRWPAVELWVETNGTKLPPDWWAERVHRTLVSPKVGTRDMQRKRLPAQPLEAWARLARDPDLPDYVSFDFTCGTRSDVLHAARICTWLELTPSAVTITPRGQRIRPGTDWGGRQQASIDAVCDVALEHGFCLTPRPLRSDR